MRKRPMTRAAIPNLVETKKLVVNENLDIQPREKPDDDDDADQLGKHGSRVKKHVSIAVGVEVKIILLTE